MNDTADRFLEVLRTWAGKQPDIIALALVGSHAKDMARPGSDIDLIVIVENRLRYLETSAWLEHFGEVRSISHEDWGLLQSKRVHYGDGTEVEFGITGRCWANTELVDRGTQEVISGGIRILYDSEGLLQALVAKVLQMPNTR